MAKILRFIKVNPTISFGIFTLIIVIILWGIIFYFSDIKDGNGYWNSVFVEFSGFILDVIVVLVIFEWFRIWQEKKQKISHQQEIIDDFKKWDREEGNLRIAGAIRRINREGKTDINFSGIYLSNFCFRDNNIKDLSGSMFISSGILDSAFFTTLKNVSFIDVDCSNVCFCDPVNCNFFAENLSFIKTNLTNANFSGAYLEWADVVEEKKNWKIKDEIGEYLPAFDSADLTNASFKNATFKKADFRGAKNIESADFTEAKGLKTCFFDDDIKEILKEKGITM